MESTAPALLDKGRRFRSQSARHLNSAAPCLVLLGRAGDIINSLPIALHYHRQYQTKIPFVVQSQFTEILNCTSYCEAIPWSGELYMTINQAVHWAKAHYRTVYPIQTWGHKYNPGMQTRSFCDEHFRLANLFGKRGELPLIFDRRNGEREQKLLARFDSKLPIILYNLSGFSSPFKHGDLVRQILSRFSGVATLIDTHTVQAHCIVDLLALYSVATALLTIDTATLHLAYASRVPYIAFTVDNKPIWHTSPPLGNCRLAIPYSRTEAMTQKFVAVLNGLLDGQPVEIRPDPPQYTGTIVHVTDSYWLLSKRCRRAMESWLPFYETNALQAAHAPTIGSNRRTSQLIGSKRILPFLKDLLKIGVDCAKDDEFVLWTNSDIILEPGFMPALRERLARTPIVVGRRSDFQTGQVHPGRDVAAFNVGWLKANWDTIPDLILGCAEVDVWMALAAREVAGMKSETAAALFRDRDPCDIPAGFVKHEDHGVSAWNQSRLRYVEPANVYNVNLLRAWCKTHQPNVQFFRNGHVNWNV